MLLAYEQNWRSPIASEIISTTRIAPTLLGTAGGPSSGLDVRPIEQFAGALLEPA